MRPNFLPAADFSDLGGGKHLEHFGDDRGLRGGLPEADGQGVVVFGAERHFRVEEIAAGHAAQGVQDFGVADQGGNPGDQSGAVFTHRSHSRISPTRMLWVRSTVRGVMETKAFSTA